MDKRIIMALALMAATTVKAQDINYYTPGENEGIAYFLPKTAIEVNVIATKVKYTPGDFCQYANRYLRMSNVSSEPQTYWEIKKIDVRSAGVPDSTKAYIVKLSDKSVVSNIEVTENGIIKSINNPSPIAEEQHDYKLEKTGPAENGKKYLTEEVLSAGSTARMAELTAKEIYNIRESKNLILRGQADAMPKDGASMKLIIDNLEKQEKALTSMFTGSEEKQDKLFSIQVSPEEASDNIVVLRFSEALGVLSKDNLAGEPIYLNVKNMSPIQNSTEDEGKKKKPKGVLYNIPGKAAVKVTFKGKTLFEENNMPVTQFGNTELLVNDLFNKKINTRVIFNTNTGGIIKIDKDQ